MISQEVTRVGEFATVLTQLRNAHVAWITLALFHRPEVVKLNSKLTPVSHIPPMNYAVAVR